MTPFVRSMIALGIAAVLRGFLLVWWENYKSRKAREPILMKRNRKGVHIPWGSVQKIERAMDVGAAVWGVSMVLCLLGLIYFKLIAPAL